MQFGADYNIISALSDSANFNISFLSNLKSLKTVQEKKLQMNDPALKNFDDLQFVMALNLNELTSSIHVQESKIYSRLMMLSWVLLALLLSVMILNFLIEYYFLHLKRLRLNSELIKIFLVYPPEVIQDNVYLVNFFELRRINFE